MKEIYKAMSQNGRYGVSIVSETIDTIDGLLRAEISLIGRFPKCKHRGFGIYVYRIEKTDKPQWISIYDVCNAYPISGCTKLIDISLQNNGDFSIILMGPKALLETGESGIRFKHYEYLYYENGKKTRIPDNINAWIDKIRK